MEQQGLLMTLGNERQKLIGGDVIDNFPSKMSLAVDGALIRRDKDGQLGGLDKNGKGIML